MLDLAGGYARAREVRDGVPVPTPRVEFTESEGKAMWSIRGVAVASLVVLVVATYVVNVAAQGADPRIGTWKVNTAKSKYSPGPPPQSLTVKVEPAGKGEKATAEFVNADGSRVTTVYTANFDGKDYPLTGSQLANTVALKRVDARTTERVDKKDGKVVQTLNRVVSADGKTMTVTVKGVNARGENVNNVVVFEKQ